MWVCPEKVNGILCDYKVKTKHLMSQHIRYKFFCSEGFKFRWLKIVRIDATFPFSTALFFQPSKIKANSVISYVYISRYSHFQRKACFVSRDENLRNAAISFEAEKARQDKIQKQQNEERLERNRKQRKLREKRKAEKEAAVS